MIVHSSEKSNEWDTSSSPSSYCHQEAISFHDPQERTHSDHLAWWTGSRRVKNGNYEALDPIRSIFICRIDNVEKWRKFHVCNKIVSSNKCCLSFCITKWCLFWMILIYTSAHLWTAEIAHLWANKWACIKREIRNQIDISFCECNKWRPPMRQNQTCCWVPVPAK